VKLYRAAGEMLHSMLRASRTQWTVYVHRVIAQMTMFAKKWFVVAKGEET
jgi:hypothetical protein